MCCLDCPLARTELLARFGRRKTLILWKTVLYDGRAIYTGYRYAPGEHVARTPAGRPWKGEYDTDYPRGIHVYLNDPSGDRFEVSRSVSVLVRKDDLLRADGTQAVFRRIRITKKAWKEAGLA